MIAAATGADRRSVLKGAGGLLLALAIGVPRADAAEAAAPTIRWC